MTQANSGITALITAYQEGDNEAFERLIPIIYQQLRQVAQSQLRKAGSGSTLAPTELVHEVFLRLNGKEDLQIKDRSHFFAIVAQCMRWVLLDYAKARKRRKRGSGMVNVTFIESLYRPEEKEFDLFLLQTAFENLQKVDPRLCKVAELRFLCGLSIEETAKTMGSSPATVKRDWKVAKAWLSRELSDAEKAKFKG
jgi:RNA polymerase sigma factor (TIGR02999 family)